MFLLLLLPPLTIIARLVLMQTGHGSQIFRALRFTDNTQVWTLKMEVERGEMGGWRRMEAEIIGTGKESRDNSNNNRNSGMRNH